MDRALKGFKVSFCEMSSLMMILLGRRNTSDIFGHFSWQALYFRDRDENAPGTTPFFNVFSHVQLSFCLGSLAGQFVGYRKVLVIVDIVVCSGSVGNPR